MRTTKFHRVSLLSLFAIVLLIIGFSFAGLIEQHEKQYENYFEMIGTTANSYSNITYDNGSSGLIIRGKSTNTGNFLLTANSGETQIRCFEKLNGFYINPSWNNLNEIGIVPLSETTLGLLQGEFENLTLMGGFYTTCISLDGNTINPDAVFGHISYYKGKAQTSTKGGDEEENINEDIGIEKTTITIDEFEGSQYQIQAGLSNEDGEINFSEQLILLGGQIDLSSEGSIIDSQSNGGTVTRGNGNYENPRERYRGSEETRKLEFLPPARSGESVRYTSGIDVYVKIYGITGYVREISGDIMESVTGIFDNYQTRIQITLTEGLGEKTIKYLGYPRDYNESAYRVYEHTYIIELTDLTPPSEGEIKINDNEQFTNNANVTLTLYAKDEGVGMTGGTMRFSCDNNWDNIERETYDTRKEWNLTTGNGCTGGDGQKTVYVQFRDAAENGRKLASASIILDTTNPTCDISISPEHWTNEPITLTITTTEENVKYSFDGTYYSNTKEQQVTANGTYTGYVQDEALNTGSCSINVTTRDDIKPVCTVNITKNSLSLIEGDNTGKVTFECIDTGSSIKTMSLTSGAIAHTNSVVTLSDNAITGSVENGVTYEFIYTAKAAGSSTFRLSASKVQDNANNANNASSTSNTVVVNASTQSCGEISYSTNSWTNENVIATLPCPEGITITSTGGSTHTFTGNGTFTFTYIDGEGHEGSALADVRWIDKTAPNCGTWTFNPAESGGPTNHDVTATMTWGDGNGESGPTSSSTGCTITSNNYCSVTITDNAGNSTGCTSQRISWIDKTAPTLTQITEIGTTGNRTPDYTFNSSEAGTISYSGSCSGENTQAVVGENTIIFNELEIGYHSDCSIIVTDAAGNNSTLNIEPFTINGHNAPTTTLIGWGVHAVPSMWRQDITVDIIRYGGATGGVIITGTNDINAINRQLGYTPVTTGYHTMHIDNESQNGKYVCAFGTTGGTTKTICSAYPIKIDITSPSLQLTNPTNGQNFNSGDTVTLQWSGYDRPSGISGYTLTITDPDNNTETYYYNSGTTSKTYTINKSGTRQRSVTVNDIVGHGVQKTGTFVIPNSGGNNGSGGGNTLGFNLISPALGDQINLGNNVVLSRHAGTTNNGYIWKIKNISGTVIASGYTTGLTATINSGLFNTGAYSWSVQDIASETTKSIPLFYIVDSQNIPDLKVRQFEFDEITNADTDEYYKSNDITIQGLSNNWYSYAYLKSGIGALYINDRFVGTSGFVKNGDEIFIEMKASDEYDETVKTTLIVGGGTNTVSGDFKITTKDGINGRDSTTLSPMQKLWGIVFIDSLVEMYQYDEEKLATFLSTFMQLLQDKSDYYADMIQEAQDDGDEDLANEYKLYKEAIDFLYTTVKYRYNNLDVEDLSVYIAPNGKQYLVEYDEDRMAYTSPDFARPKYFPTWESFTNHIDMNNPAVGKRGIVGNVVTAHNGKVYTIYETNGKWTSSNFRTAKYFDTKEDIINHILANNPASDWNHTIDTDFDEVKYTAPNGKVYKIFKTSNKGNNPNMYSSYNFVNAKYFTSLEAAKKFIDQNNKK